MAPGRYREPGELRGLPPEQPPRQSQASARTKTRAIARAGVLSAALLGCLPLLGCEGLLGPRDAFPWVDTDPGSPLLPSDHARSVPTDQFFLTASAGFTRTQDGIFYLITRATAQNITPDTVRLETLCVSRVQIAPEGTPEGTATWRSPTASTDACRSDREILIPPGGLRSVEPPGALRGLVPEQILGDSLPDGRYRIEVILQIEEEESPPVVAGIHALSQTARSFIQDPSALRYHVETRTEGIAPSHLMVRVTASNPTEHYAYLEFGACSLSLRVFPASDPGGTPVRSSEDRGRVCAGYLAIALIPPGEAISPGEFRARIPVHHILGDSLSDGRYHLTGALRFLRGAGLELTSEGVRFEAGSVDLSSRLDPIPGERMVEGVRYRARIEPVEGPSGENGFRLTLSMTNEGEAPIPVMEAGNVTCAVQIVGFRSAEERDRWYLDSRWGRSVFRGCHFRIPPTVLRPGGTLEVAADFLPVTEIAPPGRYHLLLLVRSWTGLLRGGVVDLAAGSVELTAAP